MRMCKTVNPVTYLLIRLLSGTALITMLYGLFPSKKLIQVCLSGNIEVLTFFLNNSSESLLVTHILHFLYLFVFFLLTFPPSEHMV